MQGNFSQVIVVLVSFARNLVVLKEAWFRKRIRVIKIVFRANCIETLLFSYFTFFQLFLMKFCDPNISQFFVFQDGTEVLETCSTSSYKIGGSPFVHSYP